jgi:predicted nucleotidyltransferase
VNVLAQRTKIILYVQNFLEFRAHVYALWLEGADARGKVDDYSDIDLWLDVEDGHEETVLGELEQHLRQLAPLELVYKKPHPHPQLKQWFFRFANTSEFLMLDVCVQSHSRHITFGAGDPVQVLFDKANVIRFARVEVVNIVEQARAVQAEVELYKVWVLKAVKRGQGLEALSYYLECILEPLVQVLRLRHTPEKIEYGFKHLDNDLPAEAVKRLELLTKVTSLGDLEAKMYQAVAWLEATVKELELQHES